MLAIVINVIAIFVYDRFHVIIQCINERVNNVITIMMLS